MIDYVEQTTECFLSPLLVTPYCMPKSTLFAYPVTVTQVNNQVYEVYLRYGVPNKFPFQGGLAHSRKGKKRGLWLT